MKHKILTRILIIFIGFLLIFGLFLITYLTVKSLKVGKLGMQKEQIVKENSILVEQRLAFMEIAKLDPDEEDVFEIMRSSINLISELDTKSVSDENLVRTLEDVNEEVNSVFNRYRKIMEYDIRKDFYNSLASEDYEALLGKVNALVEGMNTYENDVALQEEITNVKESASLLGESLYDQNYDGMIIMVEDLYKAYDVLRQAAVREVKEPLVSDEGVGMLKDLTNLIITNQNQIDKLE